ncbi:MAG: polyhydroxyalkanoate synthesis regulator DNA-binding domain-containing protein [Chloroflexi bacterium]|nr:polyhydroxyalkanoate synthesis regulator DNA-binding domain-containing protein [Chloroflexota bacterium]
MTVVKRYSNRKLYDTEAKQYITLQGIAELTRQGKEVTVIDNATGEDISAVTLSQVLFEQEKRKSGFLPHPLLSNLLQSSEERLLAWQRSLSAYINLLHPYDDEIRRRVSTLVARGELAAAEGERILEKLLSIGGEPPRFAPAAQRDILRALERHSLPSRADLNNILAQLEELSTSLDDLTPPAP